MKAKDEILKRMFATEKGKYRRNNRKDSFNSPTPHSLLASRGWMLRSNMDLRMERTENIADSIGMEGIQATRPRLSSMHLEDMGSFQGRWRMPQHEVEDEGELERGLHRRRDRLDFVRLALNLAVPLTLDSGCSWRKQKTDVANSWDEGKQTNVQQYQNQSFNDASFLEQLLVVDNAEVEGRG